MMAEYIEREALIKEMTVNSLPSDAQHLYLAMLGMVRKAPAADVVEVRHARFKWGYQNGQYGIWCTNCGAGWVDSENAEWIAHEHDYCPKCGGKMDGKGEDDAAD